MAVPRPVDIEEELVQVLVQVCCICQNSPTRRDQGLLICCMSARNEMCNACLTEWAGTRPTCPVCRRAMPADLVQAMHAIMGIPIANPPPAEPQAADNIHIYEDIHGIYEHMGVQRQDDDDHDDHDDHHHDMDEPNYDIRQNIPCWFEFGRNGTRLPGIGCPDRRRNCPYSHEEVRCRFNENCNNPTCRWSHFDPDTGRRIDWYRNRL